MAYTTTNKGKPDGFQKTRKEENNERINLCKNEDGIFWQSVQPKWLYSGFVNRPEWWYKEEATIDQFEEFFEFFENKTGWVVIREYYRHSFTGIKT